VPVLGLKTLLNFTCSLANKTLLSVNLMLPDARILLPAKTCENVEKMARKGANRASDVTIALNYLQVYTLFRINPNTVTLIGF
jgi:hypothetical protein